jgi:DNA polymerase I-like protein with 3'-5' exonuclease and polymerase domains
MKQQYKKPPNNPKNKKQTDGRYEEPFEAQKAKQDKAQETPNIGNEAFHGIIGEIANKVAEKTEADRRGILVGLLIGCGNIIGRTAFCRVDASRHYCNEFACLVGRTSGARKGLTSDIVEETLRLTNDVWHQGCTAYGISSGEGFVELVRDEVTKQKRIKPKKGETGPTRIETEVVKEGVTDKRKLCFLAEFGELLTVAVREGNIISMVLRNSWDGKKLEINTKQAPQRATGAHITILGNITKKELLKLLPKIPNADGFCNRFLWCLIERSQWVPKGGPQIAEYLAQEITQLRSVLARVPREPTEIERSPEAEELWKEIYNQLAADTDLARAVVDRGEAHVLRLSLLYALVDGATQIHPVHIRAAYALWRYCEASALRLFGVEELDRNEQLILDFLRAKGMLGATRTELQHKVFHNHRTGAEILLWLATLKNQELVTFQIERADNGNVVERWFALKYPDQPRKKRSKNQSKARTEKAQEGQSTAKSPVSMHEFAMNSQNLRTHELAPRADSRYEFAEFAEFATQKEKKESEQSSKKGTSPHFFSQSIANSANSANSCHQAAPVKESDFAKGCEFTANSYLYAAKKPEIAQAFASLTGACSLALDSETTNDTARLVQLCDGSNPPVILDIHEEGIKSELTKLFHDKELIIQNSKFDLRVLKNAFELEIPVSRVFDTYVASAVLTNTKVTKELKVRRRRNWHPNRLDSIAKRTLGLTLDKTFQNADWSVDLSLVENAPMLAYAANDVRHLHAIRLHLQAELENQKLVPVYQLERDLIPCVNAMSENGVCVNIDAVHQLTSETVELTAKREAVVLSLLKRKINLRSRKAQLLPALQELGLTIDGVPLASTDKKVIPLVDQKNHPAVTALLEWSTSNEEAKQLAKWPKHIDSDGVVRPQINQFGTETARFTYSSPNLQQVKKSALRSIIIAPPGHLILRADFKTIELILAAVRYDETAILEQVAKGVDLHTVTASSLFHCTLNDVLESQRSMAKTTNFSLLYGRSLAAYIQACRLAGIDMTVEELERIYRDFDKAWPNWAACKAQITQQIARRTYPRELRSMYSRRIILDASLSNRELRGALLNFPIQSSGSDVLKLTMVNVWQEKPKGFRLLASIHDEILAVLKPGRVNYAKGLLREAAADAVRRVQHNDIPIPLEMGVGRNWWEAIQDKEDTNQ